MGARFLRWRDRAARFPMICEKLEMEKRRVPICDFKSVAKKESVAISGSESVAKKRSVAICGSESVAPNYCGPKFTASIASRRELAPRFAATREEELIDHLFTGLFTAYSQAPRPRSAFAATFAAVNRENPYR